MATFSASATGPYSAKGTLTGASAVSYARTVYITVVETGDQKEWGIGANATPGTYTATFSSLEPDTTYTIACTVFKNSPWEQVAYWEEEITTDILYYMEAINKSTSAINEVYPDQSYGVEEGSRVYFQANMNYGYVFRGWYDSSSSTSDTYLVSRDNPYSFKIYEDTTLYARGSSTSLTTVEKTYNSITVKLSTAYDYEGSADYRINVYDTDHSKSIISERSISYDDVKNGYTITDLEANTTYAINIGYIPGDYAEDIIWIWKSGSAPTVTTSTGAAIIYTEIYIQNANGSYPSSANYTYSFDAMVGDTYDIEDFANTIYTVNLKNSMSSTTANSKLHDNLEFDYMTSSKGGAHMSSGTIEVQKEGDGTIYFYYNRVTYYMTLAATTGVQDFGINNVSFDIGEKLSFLYGQSIEIEANLSSSYEFTKWTAPTDITAVNGKTSNPLSFTMPASNFTITANANKITVYYYVYVKPYYEWADTNGYDDSFGESRISDGFAAGTGMIPSQYNLWANPGKTYNNNIEFSLFEVKDENDNVITSVSNIQKDRHLKYYYKRQVHTLTVKQDANKAVTSFTINNATQSFGTALSYKQGQTLNFKFTLKSNYTITDWEYTGQTISLPTSNEFSISMFNWSLTITPVTKQGIEDWAWKDYEIEAFTGAGAFATLTATRWNAFLDWCNEVLTLKGKATIGNAYYGEKDQPLYASDFNYIIDRLETVATIPSSISSTKSAGDIIKGSYFIDIAKAMNDVL